MHSVLTLVALAILIPSTLSSSVTCKTYGESSCPYTPATTSDLQTLIAQFCGDDGGYPYYQHTEQLDQDLSYGWYSVASDEPGGFTQATCDSALGEIVSECDAAGFWIEGDLVVQVGGDEITFVVVNCQLAA